ncbi:Helix-turn-helix domain [Streptococcus uberis]|nr:Helix-turn-helix domain [Streptococcus uberis]
MFPLTNPLLSMDLKFCSEYFFKTSTLCYNAIMESKNFDYKKLEKILNNQQISVDQLSKLLGITKKSIKPWLNGTTVPHKKNLDKLVKTLHISEESITKEEYLISAMEEKIIWETLDSFFEIFLPFFAYYKTNNEGYQLDKFTDITNKKNISHKNMFRHKLQEGVPTKKISLDVELENIVQAITKYVLGPDFPLKEMRETSYRMIFDLAEDKYKAEFGDRSEYYLYLETCMKSIKYIDEAIGSSTALQNLIKEKEIFNPIVDNYLSNENFNLKQKIQFHMGLLVNLFNIENNILKNLILNKFEYYSNFTKYYLLSYEMSVSDKFLQSLPIVSNECFLFLKWKTEHSEDKEFAKNMLNSLDAKIANFRKVPDEFKIEFIKLNLLDNLLPILVQETNVLCKQYLAEHISEYSIELIELFEEFPTVGNEEFNSIFLKYKT